MASVTSETIVNIHQDGGQLLEQWLHYHLAKPRVSAILYFTKKLNNLYDALAVVASSVVHRASSASNSSPSEDRKNTAKSLDLVPLHCCTQLVTFANFKAK